MASLPQRLGRAAARALALTVRLGLSAALIAGHLNLHFPEAGTSSPESVAPDIPAQLHYLRAALDDGAAADMQGWFPEGYAFTWALYGLTHVQVGLRRPLADPARAAAAVEARVALDALESPAGRAPFLATERPPLGTFYLGWSNWLRGGLLLLLGPDARPRADVERFAATCATIARALETQGPYPPSYPGQAWPADAVVAAASLRLHDTLFPPRYAAPLARWLAAVDAARDEHGLIPHSAHGRGGGTPARGSSQALILRFLYEIDPDRARVDYRTFRQRHVTTVGLFPAIREYALGLAGEGDVDSGPLVGGASAPAMVVGMGTAQYFGDRALADPLLHTLEFVGFPLPFGGKRYAFGLLPVGDAFLAWSKTARPFTRPASKDTWSAVVSTGYRLPWHGLLLLLMALVWLGPVRRWLRGR
ncbi:MAG: hypothetical protein H6706_06375 [Myxococcales bacterium]|nr:hypothetical protein [Myxococcales bacterium]